MLPDDPFITEMDPVQKLWMFYSWYEEKKDLYENYKNHAYLIGGFVNPEMLSKITSTDNNSISTSDEDFEKSLELISQPQEDMENTASLKRRRRRKK